MFNKKINIFDMTKENFRTILDPEEKPVETDSLLEDKQYIKETKLNLLLIELSSTTVTDEKFDTLLEEIILLQTNRDSLTDIQRKDLHEKVKIEFVNDHKTINNIEEKQTVNVADNYIKKYTLFENIEKLPESIEENRALDFIKKHKKKLVAGAAVLGAAGAGYAAAKRPNELIRAQRGVDKAQDEFNRETKLDEKTGGRKLVKRWLRTDMTDKENYDKLKRNLQYKKEHLENVKQKIAKNAAAKKAKEL
ncbi:MAG: hypothetical protein GY870_16590 [archaeon]|nr:hypothetical protein [archaeon]